MRFPKGAFIPADQQPPCSTGKWGSLPPTAMSTEHPPGPEAGCTPAQARPERQREKAEAHRLPTGRCSAPPPPWMRGGRGPRPAGAASSPRPPAPSSARATNLGRADVLHGGPASARSEQDARPQRRERRGEGASRGAAAAGLAPPPGAAAAARAAVGAGGARAALERAAPPAPARPASPAYKVATRSL